MIGAPLGAFAIAWVLVSIVPDITETKVLDYGCPGKIESAISCMPDLSITSIQETPKYNNYLVSAKEFFITRNIGLRNIISIFTSTSSGESTKCWGYIIIDAETSVVSCNYVFGCLPADSPVVVCVREYIDVDAHRGRLSARILIHNYCLKRLVLRQLYLSSAYANPCSVIGDNIVMSDLSLLSDRSIDLSHFFNLIADSNVRLVESNQGEDKDTERNNVNNLLSAIFPTFFAAINCAFIVYGVNKSREVVGRSVAFIVLGGVCWFIGGFFT